MAFTPTADFEINLSDELNFWAARVTKRVLTNFDRLNINKTPGGKGPQYTGDLYRNFWWTVHNASGGNKALITFYFMHYAPYLELGVGGKDRYVPLRAMTRMEQIERPDGSKRKAKPFLTSELRLHLYWLADRLFQQYRFGGTFYIVRGLAEGLGDQSITRKWVEDHKDELTEGVYNYIKG